MTTILNTLQNINVKTLFAEAEYICVTRYMLERNNFLLANLTFTIFYSSVIVEMKKKSVGMAVVTEVDGTVLDSKRRM